MLTLLLTLLAAVLPPCAVEDDPWCVTSQTEYVTHINLAPADPAPVTVEVPR
jgi:hypothetical protein